MLLRKENPGVIAIPQLGHAWISGQLARAWGNEKFAAPAPREVVCLAAEQHDIGWMDWETSPSLKPILLKLKTRPYKLGPFGTIR